MPRKAKLGWLMAAGLTFVWVGCQTTGLGLPLMLVPTLGRAERTYPERFEQVVPAAFAALDDLSVRPGALTLRDGERGDALEVEGAGQAESNVGLLGTNKDLLAVEHKGPDGRVLRFVAVELSYGGKAIDGRPIVLTARREGESTRVTAHVGHLGDEKAALAFLDRIADRLEADRKAAPPADASGR